VPVEQLQQLDVIARMKRLKSTYRSEQLDEIDAFVKSMADGMQNLGSEYRKPVEIK
jgi:uncharacterized protein YsxB (DUF464 family)